ncbi:hypothetical protein KCU83_g39, partial [Aureobasidium melanogenum]
MLTGFLVPGSSETMVNWHVTAGGIGDASAVLEVGDFLCLYAMTPPVGVSVGTREMCLQKEHTQCIKLSLIRFGGHGLRAPFLVGLGSRESEFCFRSRLERHRRSVGVGCKHSVVWPL